MASSRQIEERAAAWLLRRENAGWNAADQAGLNQWLQASALNRVAFLRLQAGWEEANRLKALGAGLPRGRAPAPDELISAGYASAADQMQTAAPDNKFLSRRLRRRGALALAATVSGLIVAAALYVAVPPAGERYATPVGGLTSLSLQDGSSVTLNTASRIRVHMGAAERRVELTEGEAFFDVAQDPARPFVVQAGSRRVVALGTKFSVARRGEDIRVVVTEGAVRLEGREAQAAPVLSAGTIAQTRTSNLQIDERTAPDVEELLSWRSGYVVFQNTALSDAVAEFNRYNRQRIVIDDPDIAVMELTGKFRATNYQAFVRLLEETFHIEARRGGDSIILTAR
jgi:transmembrane sensor